MFDPETGRKKNRNRSLLNLSDEGGDRAGHVYPHSEEKSESTSGETRFEDHSVENVPAENPGDDGDRSNNAPISDDDEPQPGRRWWIGKLTGRRAKTAGNRDPEPPLNADAKHNRLSGYGRRFPQYQREMAYGANIPGQSVESMTQYGNARSATGESPLVNPAVLLGTVWRLRVFIALTTVLGAIVGVMVALATPHEYLAISQFVYDPRQLRLTDTDFLPPSYSSESTLALVDSQVRIVDSVPVLEAVIEQLDLTDDPEFNGSSEAGFGSLLGLAGTIFSGSGDEGEDRKIVTVHNLARAVDVYRVEKTFIIQITVKTRDPVKSANIANSILHVYIDQQNHTQSALYERTAESLTLQLDQLRRDVEKAEQRVEQYKAEHDLVDAGGSLIDDEQLVKLNEQLSEIRAQKVEIQSKAETARKLNVDEILSGTSAEILESSTIGELRAEYATAKRRFDTLATSLGPRHPERIAAAETVKSAKTEVSNELRRIVASTQTELRRIVQTEQQLAADLAVMKSRQMDTSADLVRLRELEREANATSAIYESSLKRTRETREQQKISTNNIQIVAEATAPLEPAGSSRKLIAAAGLFGGFAFGMGIAVLLGLYRGFLANNTASRMSQSRAESRRRQQAQIDESDVDPDRLGLEEEQEQGAETGIDEEAERARSDTLAEETGFQTDALAGDWQDDPDKIREDIRDLKRTVERFRKAREEARRHRRTLPL